MGQPVSDGMAPCFFPARLHVSPSEYRVSITRLGGRAAKLYGGPVVAEGSRGVLEFDRPTDGLRIRLSVEVKAVFAEGEAQGWMRAIWVDFIERIDQAEAQEDSVAKVAPRRETSTRQPIRLEPLTISLDDSVDDEPTRPGTPTHPPQLDLAEAHRLARGATDLDAARPRPSRSSLVGALPAHYAAPVPRRSSAATPLSEKRRMMADSFPRESRVLSNTSVAYLTAGQHRSGAVQDFSRHGMFLAVLEGDALPAPGAMIRVEFPIPWERTVFLVGLMAEVRWTHDGDAETSHGRGAGLLIATFDRTRGREAYEEYITSLLGRPGEAR